MNGEQLQITSSDGPGVLVLHVTGCLDYDTGEQFTHYAKAAMEDAQAIVKTVTVGLRRPHRNRFPWAFRSCSACGAAPTRQGPRSP